MDVLLWSLRSRIGTCISCHHRVKAKWQVNEEVPSEKSSNEYIFMYIIILNNHVSNSIQYSFLVSFMA